jgi:H+/Cl- antiporter ClcA
VSSGGRWGLILYAIAFALMLAALASLLSAIHGFLQERWPLWLSAGLSVAAILLAIAAWVVDRRRADAPGSAAARS